MGLKETNQVRMVGVIPSRNASPIPVGKIPDDATQVTKRGSATNTTTVIHPVTASKTFYLSTLIFFADVTAAGYTAEIFVTNGQGATQYNLIYLTCRAVGQIGTSPSFNPPLEIPAGWDICAKSNGTQIVCDGFVHGYEV